MRIGVPRALLYYEFFPLWRTFFEELGAEVVVSNPTTKKTLEEGIKYSIDEACLPFKIHRGHIIELKNKVDALFVPRVASVKRGEYMCAKFLGLPDTIKNRVAGLPEIIDTDFDANSKSAKRSMYELGKAVCDLLKTGTGKIKTAYKRALQAQKEFKQESQGIQNPENITRLLAEKPKKEQIPYKHTIALVGHPYSIYDSHINNNMLKKLENLGFSVVTQEMISEERVEKEAREISKRLYWTFSKKIVGACSYYAKQPYVDGIISFVPFPCGPESITDGVVKYKLKSKKKNLPMLTLIVSEGTADAGLETRVEAFTETIKIGIQNEKNAR